MDKIKKRTAKRLLKFVSNEVIKHGGADVCPPTAISWSFKLCYMDPLGFDVTIEGSGFLSRDEAETKALVKKNEIDEFGIQ